MAAIIIAGLFGVVVFVAALAVGLLVSGGRAIQNLNGDE
jgi:hypothetical protein